MRQDTKKISLEKENRIIHFLKAVPFLEFSEKGFKNICQRFAVSEDALRALIQQELKAREKGGVNV